MIKRERMMADDGVRAGTEGRKDQMIDVGTSDVVKFASAGAQDQSVPTGNEGQPTFNDETRRRDTYENLDRSELVGANVHPATPSA